MQRMSQKRYFCGISQNISPRIACSAFFKTNFNSVYFQDQMVLRRHHWERCASMRLRIEPVTLWVETARSTVNPIRPVRGGGFFSTPIAFFRYLKKHNATTLKFWFFFFFFFLDFMLTISITGNCCENGLPKIRCLLLFFSNKSVIYRFFINFMQNLEFLLIFRIEKSF